MLDIRDLAKTYGSGDRATKAIGNVSFTVRERELVTVVGPSGCGKTTLLRCMAGLLAPSAGMVRLDGRPITSPPKEMTVVFQDYSRSLFPWLTVRQNVRLPLPSSTVPKGKWERVVDESLEAVGLTASAGKHPYELSGGMQQRVAIARALAYQPQILLMDEPFASVDAQTRADLEDLILRVRAEFGVTIVFVTHDIDEAVYIGDRVVVLSPPPTSVRESVSVDLPSPRDQISSKERPEFTALRARVYRLIRDRPEQRVAVEQEVVR
jgi:NitT/TauT family transport system ATP-binding protein